MNYSMNNLSISKLKKELNGKDGILGKEKYFNSAVLVPLLKINNEDHLLFEKRSHNIRQGGEVSFPGGKFEPGKDKDFLHTAIRETTEELGLTENQIEVLGRMNTLIAPMGVSVDPFIGELNIRNLNEVKIDHNEVERIFTLPLSFFMNTEPVKYYVHVEVQPKIENDKGEITELLPVKKYGLPEKYEQTWKGGRHRILVYETSEEIVWGITAELVYEFCKIIKKVIYK